MKSYIFWLLQTLVFFCLLPSAYANEAYRFTDENLSQVLQEYPQGGVIYTYSIMMPLSVLGIQEIIDTCASENIPLVITRDPYAEDLLHPDFPLMNAQSLIEVGIFNHFPSYTYFKNGKIDPITFYGYILKDALPAALHRKLDI